MKELDLIKLAKFLLSKIAIIIVCAIIGAGAGFGYSNFFVEPVYRTSSTILVNNGAFSDGYNSGSSIISGSNISASLSLVPTCVDILQCDKIYNDLYKSLEGEKLNDRYSVGKLKGLFLPVANKENSITINIYTYSNNPEDAVILANKFLEIVPTFIPNTIPNTDVKILSDATGAVRTEPRTTYNMGLGFIAGLAICLVILFILYLTKNTIDSEKDLKNNYDVPMLGTVPLFENKQAGGNRNGKKHK